MSKDSDAKHTAYKILVVDDEPDIRLIVSEHLEYAGCHVITAEDGSRAIDAALEQLPDLIIMDIMMPYIDGFQTLEFLKRNEKTIDIPVILLSAKSQEEDIKKGKMGYADKYMTKPFDGDELISEVKETLERCSK
ncbi:MAG: response regulator [Candidatus Omnitrophota bacterium]|nr:response regulator [Candidatus Omnitrophota bacterium]